MNLFQRDEYGAPSLRKTSDRNTSNEHVLWISRNICFVISTYFHNPTHSPNAGTYTRVNHRPPSYSHPHRHTNKFKFRRSVGCHVQFIKSSVINVCASAIGSCYLRLDYWAVKICWKNTCHWFMSQWIIIIAHLHGSRYAMCVLHLLLLKCFRYGCVATNNNNNNNNPQETLSKS